MSSTGRYHIGVNQKDGVGHLITAEKLPNQPVRYYDSQNGEPLNIKEYDEIEYMEVLKVDKLLFNKEYLKAILTVL